MRGEGEGPFYPLVVKVEMTIFIRFELEKKNETVFEMNQTKFFRGPRVFFTGDLFSAYHVRVVTRLNNTKENRTVKNNPTNNIITHLYITQTFIT